MKNFTHYAPTKIVFGEDSENKTGALCKEFGGSRIFVIYGGKSAVESGLLSRVEKSIKEAGLLVMSMGGVVPNPRLSLARKMIEAASDFKADMIVGIGGGSAIDCAKMVAHGVANPGVDVWDYYCGKATLTKSLPLGCVPTFPATGTEGSNSSVVTNDEVSPMDKRGLGTDFNRCKWTAMNPVLCMTLPKYQMGAGIADIFMHNAERFFTVAQGNHLSDEFAIGLFKDIIKYGEKVIENPTDYEAMSEVMWCGTNAHNGITGLGSAGGNGREGDWSCHQLGHALSAFYDSTHGATLSAVFGSWARYVADGDYGRFAEFGRQVLGLKETDDKTCAQDTISGIEDFFKSLGMPTSLKELLGREVSARDCKALAHHCSYQGTRSIGNLKSLNEGDMEKIYLEAR